MKTYFSPRILLLMVFGLLLVIRGIKADDKTPPSTLQIGNYSPAPHPALLFLTVYSGWCAYIGVKHRVPEEECDRKTRNGDKLKMHYRYTLNLTFFDNSGTLWSNGEVFDSSYDRYPPRNPTP